MPDSDVKGRRLLHLGGAEFQIPAIECARKLGCFVITADNRPDNPGHRVSDLFVEASTVDREAILDVARHHNIDGIMTYGSDVAAPTVCFVAEELGLPGNPLSAAEVLQRKDLFRAFQKKEGLPHPEFVVASNAEEARERFEALGGRSVVKAADSSGSKGLSVVTSAEEIEEAFGRARPFSRCGFVVVERFLTPDMLELDGDVLVQRGKLSFRHYGHNYFVDKRESYVPCGEIFPGYFGNDVASQIDEQLQHIVSALGIRSGCMNFDAILSDGRVHLLEVGLRNGGNYVPQLIQMSTSYDLTRAAVLSALGGEVSVEKFCVADAVPVASYILNSESEGRFEGFDTSPEIEEFVAGSRLFREIDSHVLPFTRGDRALGIVFFKFRTMDEMQSIMADIERHVTLRVLAGNVSTSPPDAGDEPRYEYSRYSELLSPFIRQKFAEAERGGDETVCRVISRQFKETSQENGIHEGEARKHYEAAMGMEFEGVRIRGVERLYERVIVVEPLLQCIAHCRHCLRRNYAPFHQDREDLSRIARFIGQAPGNAGLSEILITGGDPFLIPDRLQHLLDELSRYAAQLRVARIATRLPVQQPDWVSARILSVLTGEYPFRIEVATQVNHAVELFPETVGAFERILKAVGTVYNQTVLLSGVNDTLDELCDLCRALRDVGIENHYLFHCVPIAGMSSLRVSLERTLELVRRLSSCGRIPGRSKPQLCLMTDVGKITLYEGTILKHEGGRYLLQSHYDYEERKRWNPGWILPPSAEVDSQGLLRVWYADTT